MTPPSGTAFEDRFAALLAEQADLRLGPERPAPGFDPELPESTSDASRLRRFLPLIAAVVVLVLGLGVFLLVAQAHRTTIPAVTVPDGRQEILGARIAVPDGWVTKAATEFDESYYFISMESTVCLLPKTEASTRDWKKCPVWIGTYNQTLLDALNVPDAVFSLFQDLDICPKLQEYPKPVLRYGQRGFGGREAEWRSWSYRCSSTETDYFENYVVETGPDYIMSTMQNTEAARQAMAYVAEHSLLPAQTTTIRYHDQGVVTQVATAADVTTITMDRFYGLYTTGTAVRSKTSVSYQVKTPVYVEALSGQPLKAGDRIRIDTDGTNVTWIQLYTG